MPKQAVGPEIAQIAFVVKDIEAAKRRFSDLFNVEAPETIITGPQEETDMHYRGRPCPALTKLAVFKFANLSIELMEPMGEKSAWSELLEEGGEGFHHFAIRAADADAKLAELEGRGWSEVQRGNFPGGNYTFLEAESPLNCFLEVLVKH